MWKKAHPNTELRVQSVRIMHVETSWQTLERDLPVMVHVLQGMRPTAKVFMMTGTQKLRHEWSNMQDINYEELRPLQCNWMRSKERDCSLLGLRLPKSCSAWEGEVTTFRGRDAKTMPKEPSSNSAGNSYQSPGSVGYWIEGPPEDWWQLRSETGCQCATKYMHLFPTACFVVHLELHCRTLYATLIDVKASVQYMAQAVIDSPMYCVCSRSVGLYDIDQCSRPHHIFSMVLESYHRFCPADYSKHNVTYMITGHLTLAQFWSTHIVLFLDTAATLQKKTSHLCMTFCCCSQKWNVSPLHIM